MILFHHIILLKILPEKEKDTRLSALFLNIRKGKATLSAEEEITDMQEWIKQRKNTVPLFIEISGHGVIRKNCELSDPLRDKITGSDAFIWEEEQQNGKSSLAFIRKEQIAPLLQAVEEAQLPLLSVHIGTGSSESIAKTVAAYQRLFRLKHLAKKGEAGNALSRLLVHRLKIPVLLALLCITGINAWLNSSVTEKYNRLQSELLAVRRNTENRRGDDRKRTRFFQEYNALFTLPYSRLSDRIASYVPEQTTLLELSFSPPVRSPEPGKPLQLQRDIIRIRGESQNTEAVTRFTQQMAEEMLFKGVKLTSLDKKKETDGFIFEITLEMNN